MNFDNDLDVNFFEQELRRVIFSLNNNKSLGIDNITAEILKASYEFISPFLLPLYNRILIQVNILAVGENDYCSYL